LNIKVNKLEEKQKTDTVKTIEEKIEKIESVNLKKAVVEPKKQIIEEKIETIKLDEQKPDIQDITMSNDKI